MLSYLPYIINARVSKRLISRRYQTAGLPIFIHFGLEVAAGNPDIIQISVDKKIACVLTQAIFLSTDNTAGYIPIPIWVYIVVASFGGFCLFMPR